MGNYTKTKAAEGRVRELKNVRGLGEVEAKRENAFCESASDDTSGCYERTP
ncbi:MAG: hypothetical protein JSV16_00535 [Candidatus Hydrogenedentota bacterium]|nr:MAG: hypothetical protein JSV16_00535 [Candidatus Hydrogenedentota bacterium]